MGVNLIGLGEDAPPVPGRAGAPRPAGDFRRPPRPASRLRARLSVGLALVLSIVLVFVVVSRFGAASNAGGSPPPQATAAKAVSAPAPARGLAASLEAAAVAGRAGHFGIARAYALRAGRADLAGAYEQAGLLDASRRARAALAQGLPRHALRIVRTARRRYDRPTALQAVAAQATNALSARRRASGGAAV